CVQVERAHDALGGDEPRPAGRLYLDPFRMAARHGHVISPAGRLQPSWRASATANACATAASDGGSDTSSARFTICRPPVRQTTMAANGARSVVTFNAMPCQATPRRTPMPIDATLRPA